MKNLFFFSVLNWNVRNGQEGKCSPGLEASKSGVNGDDFSATTSHKQYSLQTLSQDFEKLHVCFSQVKDKKHQNQNTQGLDQGQLTALSSDLT